MKEGRRATDDVRRDVADEVSFHIESTVRDLVAEGMDEATARREAYRRFGSVERVEGELRQIGARRERRTRTRGWALDLSRDVRFALRNLRRNPAWAAMMVVILGLGLAVNVAVLRVVDGALLRPLPYADGDALVRVFAGEAVEERFGLSWPEYQDWSREAEFLGEMATGYQSGVTLRRDGGEPEALTVARVTGSFARVVGVAPLAGRALTEEDVVRGEHVAVLDEATWRSRFGGSPDVVGTSVWLNETPHVIVGVLPSSARAALQMNDVALWLPFAESSFMVRTTHFLRSIARLPAGVDAAAAAERAERLEAALVEQGITDHGIVLLGVREQIVAPVRTVLLVLAGAVGFVLLIVCANLTNLFLARAMGRSREFAVRASLGAGRLRIARQIATEGAVIGLLGGVLGLLLSRLLRDIVGAATGQAAMLAPGAGFDVRTAAATLLLSLLTGIAIGVWPALRAGRTDSGAALSAGTRTAGDRQAWAKRRWLVGLEVAFTVVLVAAAGLMVRSVARLLDQDPGFTTRSALTFQLDLPVSRYGDEAATSFYARLLDDIRAMPGVAAAGAVTALPLSGNDTNGSFRVVGVEHSPDDPPHGKKRVATPGYFEALGIPLLEGRALTADDRAGGRDVMVISESLARQYFPDGAVGRFIEFSWGPPGQQEIVGVVGDVLHDGLDQAPVPTMYRSHAHFAMTSMTFVVSTAGDPLSLAPAVREAVRALDPLLPLVDVRSLEQVVAASVGDRRTLMRLLGGFAALALLLAALGVYAVTAQAVQGRTREIGVRMAVGARAGDVLRMVMREELVAIVLGLALGVVGTLAATRVLEASLFGVTATDPLTLAGAVALIVVAALLATLVPARRAATTDPAEALRSSA